jgi:hypothetical protein
MQGKYTNVFPQQSRVACSTEDDGDDSNDGLKVNNTSSKSNGDPAVSSLKTPPSKCPFLDCDDPFPSSPSQGLLRLIRTTGAVGPHIQNYKICAQIKKEMQAVEVSKTLYALAGSKGWPLNPNFEASVAAVT